jgi:hypothetical protein
MTSWWWNRGSTIAASGGGTGLGGLLSLRQCLLGRHTLSHWWPRLVGTHPVLPWCPSVASSARAAPAPAELLPALDHATGTGASVSRRSRVVSNLSLRRRIPNIGTSDDSNQRSQRIRTRQNRSHNKGWCSAKSAGRHWMPPKISGAEASGQGPRTGLAWAPFPNLYPDWRYLFY